MELDCVSVYDSEQLQIYFYVFKGVISASSIFQYNLPVLETLDIGILPDLDPPFSSGLSVVTTDTVQTILKCSKLHVKSPVVNELPVDELPVEELPVDELSENMLSSTKIVAGQMVLDFNAVVHCNTLLQRLLQLNNAFILQQKNTLLQQKNALLLQQKNALLLQQKNANDALLLQQKQQVMLIEEASTAPEIWKNEQLLKWLKKVFMGEGVVVKGDQKS